MTIPILARVPPKPSLIAFISLYYIHSWHAYGQKAIRIRTTKALIFALPVA